MLSTEWTLATLWRYCLCVTVALSIVTSAAADSPASVDPADAELTEEALMAMYQENMQEVLAKLERKTGVIELPNGVATLKVPESFYYLDPEDANVVLTEIWGNPQSDELSLGMLFPANTTPFDNDSWGVTIDYVSEGYVDDEDAGSIDYSDLLKSMKAEVNESSAWRVEQGYEAIELVGWAKPPYYSAAENKLYWAKELKFGDMEDHTLNYNIRVLGRKGYLLLNFVASMDQLSDIESNLDTVLAVAEFNEGERYADFMPGVDKVAAYGIGALVAGKVLAKTGLIAMGLILLKKFWFILAIAIAGAFKFIAGRSRKGE